MKSRFPQPHLPGISKPAGPACLAALIGLILAAPGRAADPAGIAVSGPSFLERLLPRRIEAGPLFGLSATRVRATAHAEALVRPTSAPDRLWEDFTWGGMIALHWNHAFTLSLAPRRETYGLATREETVAFPGSPFPHSLKAETELTYNVWPVLLGMRWSGRRHSVQAKVGAYAALLVDADIRWTADGNPEYPVPSHHVKGSHGGWITGLEYGLRLGPGTLVLEAETQRSAESLLSGLEGTLEASGSRVQLAYLWAFLDRRP